MLDSMRNHWPQTGHTADAAVAASVGRMVYCSLQRASSWKVSLKWLDPGESGRYHYTRYLSHKYRGNMAKVFQSLHRQNLSDRIVEQIGLSIMRNDFQPGDALSCEPELSLQFNVSRPVVREALNTLRAKALIESRPKKGVRVRPRNDWNVLDPEVIGWLYEVGPDRSFLDSLCEVRQ